MKWLAIHRLLSSRIFRHRLLVVVLAALMGMGQLLQGARPAAAAASSASTSTSSGVVANDLVLDPSLLSNYAPPPLLNVYDLEITYGQDGGLVTAKLPRAGRFAATAAQQASLRNLEDQAINGVLTLHGLGAGDYRAAQSWGRTEALAQLYGLLMAAIDASPRTTDQQNAVDWLAAVAKRQAIAAAESAGTEYVAWAGLSKSTFGGLLASETTTESQFASFLSGNPQPYNHTNLDLADGGYCLYRAPAPYGSEYTGNNHPTCFAPCSSIFGCNPPTPSYDSFVKWGQASASYASLNSVAFARTAQHIAMATGIAAAVGVASGLTAVVPAVAISATGMAAAVELIIASAAESGITVVSTVISPFTGTLSAVAAAAGVAAIVIVAITIAVVQGINVVNATKLPGQIAELINDARTTNQDPKTLKSTTNGQTSLFSLFVGATMPEPTNDSCDNSPTAIPGITIEKGLLLKVNVAPCLNPTPIHKASPEDPKFLVQEQSAAIPTVTQTLSWKDSSTDAASTATFSSGWFVIDSAGSRRQSLQFDYTDWDGKDQSAWLLQDEISGGYMFVSFTVPPVGATADLSKSANDTIKYLGSDGKKYSAKVKVQSLPTGSPRVTSTAIEGQPVTVDANDFKPGDAVDPVTYKWRFEDEYCHVSWATCLSVLGSGPSFGGYVDGAKVDHTWQAAGPFLAEVTATDATGASATTQLVVNVANEKPLLSQVDSNAATATVKVDQDVSVRAHFDDIGNLSALSASIDWGDGTVEPTRCISHLQRVCPLRFGGDGGVIQLSESQSTVGGIPLDFKLDATHHYAAGTYRMKLTVWDHLGAAVSRTLDVTVVKYTQPINFQGHQDQTYGDGPTGVVATPLTWNGNLTFAVTGDPSVCSITGQGQHEFLDLFVADVDILNAGECTIAASQPGSELLDPGLATQSFTVHPAPLTVTASSATITYGDPIPAVTPGYDGFVNGDDPGELDTAPVCQSSAPGDGTAGSYETTCAGGADANYAVESVTGLLWIQSAATGLGLVREGTTTPVTGEPVTFTATVSGQVPGMAAPGGHVAFLIGDELIVGCDARPVELGAASCTTSTLGVGSHQIHAIYTGDTNYESSPSADVPTTIDKAATTASLIGGSATVTGEPVTFRATVAAKSPGSGQPNGTVAFTDGGATIVGCDAQAVDPSSGEAICTVRLAAGSHSIGAAYSGDQSYLASDASAIATFVAKAATSTSVGASATPSIKGKAVTFTATIAVTAPGSGAPSGTVTFFDGTTRLGTGQLTAVNGLIEATFSTSSLSAGRHMITAQYAGDGGFVTSTSVPLAHDVLTDLGKFPKLESGAYDLRNANLKGAYLRGASLVGADLTGANLANANFTAADLTGATLGGGNVSGAIFTESILVGATLSGNFKAATFGKADLTGATFINANLRGAKGLSTAILADAVWTATMCPDGTMSDKNGGTCIGHL